MPLFIENLLENRWAIQVMQHALSLLTHAPLRLLDRTKLSRNPVPEYFKDGTFFGEVPGHITGFWQKREKSPWLTRPSNIHPLVQHLRRNPKWLAWEHYFMADWLWDRQDEGVALRHFFHEFMHLSAYPLKLGHLFDGFLVIGPSFTSPDKDSDEEFYNIRVKIFVSKVIESLSTAKPPFQYDYDRDELMLLGASRGSIKQPHLLEKTEMLGEVFETLFNIESDLPVQPNLQRCTYNQLAQTSYLLSQDDIKKITSDLISNGKSIYFDLVQREVKDQQRLVVESAYGKLKLKTIDPENISSGKKIWLSESPSSWQIRSESHTIAPRRSIWKLGRSSALYSSEKPNKNQPDYVTDQLECFLRTLKESYQTLHNGYAKESLTRFSNWLDNNFGLVSEVGTGDQDARDNNMYFRIAREVTNIFTADTTQIYVYDYPKQELVNKFIYFQGKLLKADRRKRRDELKDVMIKARSDETGEQRSESISYRCADRKESCFCRAWDPDSNQFDPSDQPFLSHKTEPFFKSIISVPMLVNRRLFGVVEIAGHSPYQFRFANQTLAEDVANILGTFLYQKEVMGALNRLSHTILDRNKDDQEKYDHICQELTGIFGADGSVLYVPRGNRHDEFQLAAYCNRPDLHKFSRSELDGFILKEGQTGSLLLEAFKSGKWPQIKTIEELEKDYPRWRDQLPQRQGLPDLFDWQVAIPVYDLRGRDKECLGGLYLYYANRNNDDRILEPLSDRWKPTIEFMTHYLALLIEAMQTQRKQEEMLQNILRHELRQTVGSVAQRAEDIINYLKNHKHNFARALARDDIWQQINSRVNIMYKDLFASQKLLVEMVKMLQAESFKNLMTSGLDPILYLITQGGEINPENDAEEIDLKALFYEIWKSMEKKSEYKSKGIHFINIKTTSGPLINANKTIVRGIFDNLFSNAAKYSIENSDIKASIGDMDEDSLIIHITNEAKSIDPDETESIFEFGYRGKNASDNIIGEGYGLAYARRLCEVLGAGLELELEEMEKGRSRYDFKVVLPLRIVTGKYA